jgi:hypothetical protein
LPVEVARKGQRASIRYFGEALPAKVDDDPQFDAAMSRLKA